VAQKKTLSITEFTKVYANKLKSVYKEKQFILTSDTAIAYSDNGNNIKMYPDNAYREYLADPGSLDKVLTKYIAATAEVFKEKKLTIENIVPLIKPAEYINSINFTTGSNGNKPASLVYEKYNEQLIIVYAQNFDNGLAMLTDSNFIKLGIGMDSLRRASIKNLNKALPEIKTQGNGTIYGVMAGGTFEASLLLLPYMWDKKNFNVKGDFVVSVPNRDILLVTGSDDKEGLTQIKEITAKIYQTGDHQISPGLFKWNGAKFIKFEP